MSSASLHARHSRQQAEFASMGRSNCPAAVVAGRAPILQLSNAQGGPSMSRAFSGKFSDLLQVPAETLQGQQPSLKKTGRHLNWFPNSIKPSVAKRAIASLEAELRPLLKPQSAPIPRDSISKMVRNYSEALPKTLRNSSIILNSPRSRAAADCDPDRAAGNSRLAELTSVRRIRFGLSTERGQRVSGHSLLSRRLRRPSQ